MQLHKGDLSVGINKGELVSFKLSAYEFIHQKGSPGWGSSDTEMFPIIGPTSKANFNVKTPAGKAVMDQHGLFRELEYDLEENTETKAIYKKVYAQGEKVKNSKYPEKSTEEWLYWPYSFTIKKTFELLDNALKITFDLDGDKDMPFMLGYHPAFKIHDDAAMLETPKNTYSIHEIMEVGDRALEVPNASKITMLDTKKLEVSSKGFGHFMLWSPTSNMVCIEPITFYPYSVNQQELDKGFQKLTSDNKNYHILLTPLD